MPRNQNQCTSHPSPPTTSRHCRGQGPLPIGVDGPHHRPTKVLRFQYHPNDRRSGMFQSSEIHPLSQNDRWTRRSQRVSETPRAMVRSSTKNHLGSRPPFHVPLLENTLRQPRNKSKPIHSLSPANRRTDGTNERMGRTISKGMDHGETRQLGKNAARG